MKLMHNGDKWIIVSEEASGDLVASIPDEKKVYELNKTSESVRTWKANRALHKYYRLVADALNDGGYSVQYVLNRKRDIHIKEELTIFGEKIKNGFDWVIGRVTVMPFNGYIVKLRDKILSYFYKDLHERLFLYADAQISWTDKSVKYILWKEFQKALTYKESTTEISSKDIDIIYKELDLHLTKNFSIESIDFPSEESMRFKELVENA